MATSLFGKRFKAYVIVILVQRYLANDSKHMALSYCHSVIWQAVLIICHCPIGTVLSDEHF